MQRFAESIVTKVACPGQAILTAGDRGDTMIIVRRGRAQVEVQGAVIAQVTPVTCLGEMAVLGIAQVRTATIRAETGVEYGVLSRQSVLAALQDFRKSATSSSSSC